MPNKEHEEWRKTRINKISDGAGAVTQLTIKRSVDVLNSVVEDLAESIDKSSRSSSRLSLIIAICTAFLVAVGIADLCVRIFNIGAKCP